VRGSITFRLLCICCLGAAFIAPVADASGQHSISTLSSLNAGVLTQLNLVRAQYHLAPLQVNDGLTAAASQHSSEMATDGYFAHSSANGGLFWKRILQYYPQLPSKSWSVGENLLWTSGPIDPQQALARWMASPDHRANILNPLFRDVGISSISEPAAPGTYDGLNVVVITTDFGIRH
jgi:uncharacterized protein YkwD